MDVVPNLTIENRHCLSGARAEPGGLHWGHAYGATAGVDVQKAAAYYFVIGDTSTTAEAKENSHQTATDFLAWINLLGNVHVVLESEIRAALDPLVVEIERLVPRRWLETAHPHRREIVERTFNGSIGDYIFPVHQAAFTLGLGVEVVCFNDDNAFVTDFARRVGKRISRGSSPLVEPWLFERVPPNLIGGNGTRMCKANRNTVSIFADPSIIRRYVKKVVGLSVGDGDPKDCSASTTEVALATLTGIGASELESRDAFERMNILTGGMVSRAEAASQIRNSIEGEVVEERLLMGVSAAEARIAEVLSLWSL